MVWSAGVPALFLCCNHADPVDKGCKEGGQRSKKEHTDNNIPCVQVGVSELVQGAPLCSRELCETLS